MLLVLLQNRFRILLYAFRNKRSPRARRNLLRIVLLFFLPYWVFQSTYNLYKSWQFLPDFHAGIIGNYLFISLGGLFMLLLMSGIPLALHYYFLSDDRALLAVQPISQRTLFFYKTIELCLTNSTLFLLIGLPVIMAAIIFLKIPAIYLLPILLGMLLYLVIPSIISAMLASLMALVLPIKRTRRVSSVILGLIIIAIWVSIQFFRVSRLDPYSQDFDSSLFGQTLNNPSFGRFNWLPPFWFVRVVMTAHTGDLPEMSIQFILLFLTAGVLLLLTGAFWQWANSRELLPGNNRQRKPVNNRETQAGPIRNNNLILTLALRDYRLQSRDSRFVTQFFFYLAIIVVFPMLLSDPMATENETLAPFVPFIFMIPVISLMAAGIAARSIPLERRSFFYNLIGPLPPMVLAISKLIVPLLATIPVILIGFVSLHLVMQTPWRAILLLLPVFVFQSMSVSVLGLLVGTRYKKNQWDNPRQMLGETGNLVLNLGVIVYCIIIAGIGYLALNFGLWQAVFACVLTSSVVTALLLRVSSRQLALVTD